MCIYNQISRYTKKIKLHIPIKVVYGCLKTKIFLVFLQRDVFAFKDTNKVKNEETEEKSFTNCKNQGLLAFILSIQSLTIFFVHMLLLYTLCPVKSIVFGWMLLKILLSSCPSVLLINSYVKDM
jgi:hypothetical protein